MRPTLLYFWKAVISVKTGIQTGFKTWILAFAGMTNVKELMTHYTSVDKKMKNRSNQFLLFLFLFSFQLSVDFSFGDERAVSKSSKFKKATGELEKVTKPIEKAVTKTAQTAAKEIQIISQEAHSIGGRFLQSTINIMTAASPGKTRVYLPAPSSDPNSGVTIGFLPVFLFMDKEEKIQHILAPSITYNRLFGANVTMRHYWYPRLQAQFFSIASYSIETNRRVTVRYEDSKFFRDWFYFKFDCTILRDGSLRFFGVGPKSTFQNQSNYTLMDHRIQLSLGLNFLEKFRFSLAHQFRFADMADGPINTLPKISTFIPRPEGLYDPKTIFTQRFSLSYDSRDSLRAPTRGHSFNIFGEVAGPMGGDIKYERLGTELKGLYPLVNNRFVTVWRFSMEGENGDEKVPVYERALLGGRDSLRGFGEARFVDRNKVSFSLEERTRFYTLKAFNVNVDFEIAPFYDVGTVFRHLNSFQFSDLHHVGGAGFRFVVRPNVVGVVDLGFGEEGSTIYVGIDYPF